MRIGLFGGAFNPIHLAHIELAEAAKKGASLDEIILIPSVSSKDKKIEGASNQQRLDMIELVIVDRPDFQVSTIELSKDKFSYTIDTIRQFKKLYPKDELFYIIGEDQLLDLKNWKGGMDILNECHFICATRPGFDSKKIPKRYSDIIIFIDVGSDISSTEIRDNVKDNKSIEELVDPNVQLYIKQNKLYVD